MGARPALWFRNNEVAVNLESGSESLSAASGAIRLLSSVPLTPGPGSFQPGLWAGPGTHPASLAHHRFPGGPEGRVA